MHQEKSPSPLHTQRSPRFIAYFMLGAGILCLSMSSFFVHWSEAPGIVTSFYRMTLASLILTPFVLRQGNLAYLFKRKNFWFVLAGGLFTSLDHSCWSTAVGYTQIATATLLNHIAPLWVALFVVIFWREKLSRAFWIGLGLTLAGALVIFGSDLMYHPQLNGGNLLALISSFFYCGYFLVTQRGRDNLDALTYIWGVTLTSAVFLFLYCLFFHFPMTGYSSTTYWIFLGAALISQTCGHFSLAFALGHLPASVVSPTMITQPVITALAAIPLAGQSLSAVQMLGGIAVLGGIYLVNRLQIQGAG